MNAEQLDFTVYCVSNIADTLGMNASRVYSLLRKSGILTNYILPSYDVLHTFSKEYITDDLISLLKEKGAIQ